MAPFRLFFAHSFANDKWNHLGQPDAEGISDRELADQVVRWIGDFSRGRIEVVRTCDPFDGYVSSTVRRDISSSDGVLCLFTKRTKDHLTELWIPSTYVLSEGSAALMQFPNEAETHRRLFGLVEKEVDPSQLGMAFHGNKVAPRFQRNNLPELKSHVERIVCEILDEKAHVPIREDREYLSLDKVVSIWRNGAVLVETRHRYRFTAGVTTVEIPHRIWRVSKELPMLKELLQGSPKSGRGFLRMIPLDSGRHDPDNCRFEIKPGHETRWGFEREFIVKFPDVGIGPGEELAYEVVWGYDGAFHNPDPATAVDDRPNSVGLTTNGRGTVGWASLTLKFQRDLDGEPGRTLETLPNLSTTDSVDLPGAQSPIEFFHDPIKWKPRGELLRCREQSCTLFEAYRWTASPFRGMAKAIWTPHVNYFDTRAPAKRRARRKSRAKD